MADDYRIHLNFLPVLGDLPAFRVYRKQRGPQESRPNEAAAAYSLPVAENPEERQSYWVQLQPSAGFEEFVTQPDFNNDLTCWALFHALCDSARGNLPTDEYIIPKHSFITELSLFMQTHSEGQELLVVQPYFLRATRHFGCLVDFHFRLRQGVPFSRRVQQLSLSLNESFRRNLDYYLDRSSKIVRFVEQRRAVLASIRLSGAGHTIALDTDFTALPAGRLGTKTYVFANGRESRSQFNGLRDVGPLQPLAGPPKLLFVFRESDRQLARTLALALRGSKQRERFGFPGFEVLFKSEIEIDANPFVLTDLSRESFSKALDRLKADRQTQPNTLPVFILPKGDENGYLDHKAAFAHEGIPTQVCTLPVIQDENALKWAIANIALQVFCKAGGQPWKVRPTAERSLIIGISQSHKIQFVGEVPRVEKYFAFSVMTDNSGLFQRIQVLGESGQQSEYLEQIRDNLRQILAEGAEQFSRVVVHTSFKLKHTEIDAIQATVAEQAAQQRSKCRFAVVKVNHKSRFFGVNRHVNSLVPYEATSVRLGRGEYLVWFEGIFPDKPTVTKAFPGPTHLQFLRVSDESGIRDEDLLQDLVNLSGANWRGFNAKSSPVSVFYCHLVAQLVHDFHERGLPLPKVHDIRPWFL